MFKSDNAGVLAEAVQKKLPELSETKAGLGRTVIRDVAKGGAFGAVAPPPLEDQKLEENLRKNACFICI
mgnify:CR=1 FL=1